MTDTTKKITPENQNISIQNIVEKIKLGFDLQEKEISNLLDDEILYYNDAIIIAPDYQRDYRSNVEDESSLIESILLGIPIPPVFLVHKKEDSLRLMNVVDGQHRLRAFYRYKENLFSLKGLTILKEYDGFSYNKLPLEIKQEINSTVLSAIVFKNFPEKDFELEIFRRYNKGTKPLSAAEIRHAVYNSKLNILVNEFSNRLFKDKSSPLALAYNVTKDKLQKKKLQESIFIIMSILESGINQNLQKSPYYAETFMKEKSLLEKNRPDEFEESFKNIKEIFSYFNKFIDVLTKKIQYPFSKELYGISQRNYKFQISIAMILTAIFRDLYINNNEYLKDIIENEECGKCDAFLEKLKNNLSKSFLEDPNYNASTTNPSKLIEVVKEFISENSNN